MDTPHSNVTTLNAPTAAEVAIPRMTTIRETAKTTGISEYAVRKLIKKNEVVYVKAGAKYLVNLDRFVDFLNGQN
ncbi:hypothetical protein N510_003471 [Firmicutes bacterium ASF500]|nr:hypothetical protein N510_003471 [Firmicutes bacterium ASF500]